MNVKNNRIKMIILAIIFIACIARGIPDSILGSAWPAMRSDLALPDTRLGIIMFIIAAFIILTNLCGPRFLDKLSTEAVTTVSIVMMALSFFLYTRVTAFWQLCLLCVPIGIATGVIEQALNNYVALHYKPKYMNYLHCFIGLGIIASPYLMSLALSGGSWRHGFFTVFLIEAVVALLILPSFPLWKKAADDQNAEDEPIESKSVPFYQLLKKRSMRMMVISLFLTNVIEYTCGTWGCTYLVEARSFSDADAAKYITVFYVGMTVGRLISGFLSDKISAPRRMALMTGIAASGILLTILPLSEAVTVIGLFVTGLGNGPVYPSLISLTPTAFGREITGSAMGVEIASAFFAVMLTPILYSLVKSYLYNGTFVLFLVFSVAVMALSSAGLFAEIKKTSH